ncbi:ABC transporter ATP-binding protein [Rubellimicrobium roseum]|uniref:ABC transporter ATP-binding protein n=1 Tax=Rubellimicrobium roseum TaxID=687525 RepID=A0A5C4N946_9RHOB|nr:ABC transporter ATP-binding protein [Rubellimicrobium roseum]TNC62883.1 ABC transporter ATP-binding protein [Rubellimicrobium roseum]
MILVLRSLSKTFETGQHRVQALSDVTLEVAEGECMAIVGESGSGKSTLANVVLGLYPPTSGEITFEGEPLPAQRTLAHRQAIQLVQQNPASALNPRRSVAASLRLALDVHGIGEPRKRRARVEELLGDVGLDPSYATRAPAALSGGQRQRVAIARALACESRLVVLDEPTSALDVLVQAQVLRLLDELRTKRNLTYLFITHDLAVVRNIATRVAVFQKGRMVEIGPTETIFSAPSHSYTRSLISAVPVVTPEEFAMRERLGGRS